MNFLSHDTLKRVGFFGMLFSTVLLTGAGCTLKLSASSASVLVSTDSGLTWESRSKIIAGKDRFFELTEGDVTRIVFDTTNPDVMFFGTKEGGLYGSNTAGRTWNNILPGQYVNDIGLNPQSRCTLTVLTPIRVLKTTNCGTVWEVMLNETRPEVGMTVLTIDQFHPNTVYVATSVGDLFRSNDGGSTWSVLKRFAGKNIRRLIIDPRDSGILYIATDQGILYKSTNRGKTWVDISESLRAAAAKEQISLAYRNFSLLPGMSRFFYASDDGLFRSLNGGVSWQRIPTLTPLKSSKIFAARPDSNTTTSFFYATKTTFYRTLDSGAHWVARPVLTTHDPSIITPHPTRRGVVYVGTRRAVDQSAYWYQGTPDY